MRYTIKDESINHGNGSPSSIKDEEKLLKFIFHPDHITGNGEIAPSAVSVQDLSIHDRGLSVDRILYADKEIIKKNISNQQERLPDKRETPEFCSILCHDIRSIVDEEGKRGLLVIDNATENNIAHSIICSAYDKKPSIIKKLRNKICSLLNQERTNDIDEALALSE